MAIMRLCKCLRAEKAKPEDLDEDPNPEHRLLIALWLRHAPRFIQRVLYSGNDMSNLQRHLVSLIIGIIVGLLTSLYQVIMKYLLYLFWSLLPSLLGEAGVWNAIPSYWWNFFISSMTGLITGIALFVFSKTETFKDGCGTIGVTLGHIHADGTIPARFILPMWSLSLLTIAGGGSLGPEAPVVIMLGAVGSWLGSQLTTKIVYRRIFSLAGASAGLAGFFGLPLGATLFALELPHSMSVQYYEALSPSIVASLASVIIEQSLMSGGIFGGKVYVFSPLTLTPAAFLYAAGCGVVAGLCSIAIVLGLRGMKWLRVKTKINPIIGATMAGIILGVIGMVSPPSMMWGEYEVPFVIADDNSTMAPPFVQSPGILGNFDGTAPWQWAIVTAAKALSIYVAVGGGYPGGIVFPLFFLGALIGKLFCVSVGIDPQFQSLWILCMMTGLQGAVTRTPWGTVLLVLGLHGWDQTAENNMTIFPALLFTAMVVALAVSYPFPLYKQQHGRRDLKPSRSSKPKPDPIDLPGSIKTPEPPTETTKLINSDLTSPTVPPSSIVI